MGVFRQDPNVRLPPSTLASLLAPPVNLPPRALSFIAPTHFREEGRYARQQPRVYGLAAFAPAAPAGIYAGTNPASVQYARPYNQPVTIKYNQAAFAVAATFVPYTAAKVDQRPFIAPVRLPFPTLAGLITPADPFYFFTGPDPDKLIPYTRVQQPPVPAVYGNAPFAPVLGFVPRTQFADLTAYYRAPTNVVLPFTTFAATITPPDPFYVFTGANLNSAQYARPYNQPTLTAYSLAPFQITPSYVPLTTLQGYARTDDRRQPVQMPSQLAFGPDAVPPTKVQGYTRPQTDRQPSALPSLAAYGPDVVPPIAIIPTQAYARPTAQVTLPQPGVAWIPTPTSVVPPTPLVGFTSSRWEVVRLQVRTTDITSATVPLVPPPLWQGYQQRQEYRRPDERARINEALYRVLPFSLPTTAQPGYIFKVSAGEFVYVVKAEAIYVVESFVPTYKVI